MDFVDRILRCSDCGNDFVFTAGEQLFFFDRQFKNDPKRCKLCKAKRAGLGRSAEGVSAVSALPLSRTETRTQCSECGVETTVPFKPTQGRPVFCRSCFQIKRVPAAVAAVAGLDPVPQTLEATDHNGSLAGGHHSMSAATVENIAAMPAAAMVASDAVGPMLDQRTTDAAQA